MIKLKEQDQYSDKEAWIFAAQDQSLRKILVEGKASTAPKTASTVKEIVSYLASRGNPSFLDLDD